MEQQAAQRQHQQQDDESRPSFTTFWKRSKDALTPRKITFVQQQQRAETGAGSGTGIGMGAGLSGNDNGEGELVLFAFRICYRPTLWVHAHIDRNSPFFQILCSQPRCMELVCTRFERRGREGPRGGLWLGSGICRSGGLVEDVFRFMLTNWIWGLGSIWISGGRMEGRFSLIPLSVLLFVFTLPYRRWMLAMRWQVPHEWLDSVGDLTTVWIAAVQWFLRGFRLTLITGLFLGSPSRGRFVFFVGRSGLG
ncbi:hypothetical protein QBC34DRAFT_50274 [Podospora aff. communis PSN243]|uniref:Uncharacterized protein n=1 Tax=Podospora aff. communis PSN243 TaxID=3040156 RepID=A0AAV9GTN9_9PEZI|nr:hypothetical protein QBC34DRAFT_50274 [Podospora aff. communis PSN243]